MILSRMVLLIWLTIFPNESNTKVSLSAWVAIGGWQKVHEVVGQTFEDAGVQVTPGEHFQAALLELVDHHLQRPGRVVCTGSDDNVSHGALKNNEKIKNFAFDK